jgi:serine/threonine protein kinase
MSTSSAPTFEEGQTLQEYRLRRLRGRSAFTFVWEAENVHGEPRALKFLPNPDDPATRQEIRAIQMVAPLQHKHLTPIEKLWTIPKFFVIAMPLADASLQDLFEAYQAEYSTGIPPAELCDYLSHAGAALDFLNLTKHHLGSWPCGIQHCDIQPSNLLLFGDTVKLADYNLASPTNRLLQFGTRLGPPGYIAPEVWNSRLTDNTDQYALAITYCYLRGGRLPLVEKPPEPGQLPGPRPAPDLSMLTEKERPIIAKALAVSAHDRWKSCKDMMAELTKAVGTAKPAR